MIETDWTDWAAMATDREEALRERGREYRRWLDAGYEPFSTGAANTASECFICPDCSAIVKNPRTHALNAHGIELLKAVS